jgi:GPH family glycoside/pentoside/hexuronide:cation symporter
MKYFMNNNFWNSPHMDPKVPKDRVTWREKIFGHCLGPLGIILLNNTILALTETFFMKRIADIQAADPAYYAIMGKAYFYAAIIARLAGIFMGIGAGYLVQKTRCRQGRLRPWHLVFGHIGILSGAFLFFIPQGISEKGYYVFFYLLFFIYSLVGTSIFETFYKDAISLSTRNMEERTEVTFARKVAWTLLSGFLVGYVVNDILLPYWLEADIRRFGLLLLALCLIAEPLLWVEYFFTRERVTEDIRSQFDYDETLERIPLKEQMNALFSDRTYMFFFLASAVTMAVQTYQGADVSYYFLRFVLRGTEDPDRFWKYPLLTGLPLLIGFFIILPLVKRFSIRRISLLGFTLILLGDAIGLFSAGAWPSAILAGLLKQTGMIPQAYVLETLLLSAYDSVEHRSGFRLEGMAGPACLLAGVQVLFTPLSGTFERILTAMGFRADAVTQSASVQSFITFSWFGVDMIAAAVWIFVLLAVNIERDLPRMQADLRERRRQRRLQERLLI